MSTFTEDRRRVPQAPLKFLVVDDSRSIVELVSTLLRQAGHEVAVRHSSLEALRDAEAIAPDCILLDLMMPEMDGFELYRRLREKPALDAVKVVILSSKSYEYDRRRAKQMGADGYLVKPINPQTFTDELHRLLSKHAVLSYWGVRGTLPVPGPGSVRYGGNTSCITFEAEDEPLIIFDAGSGIKNLSDHLLAQGSARISGKLLISHAHWDHINAFLFFGPLYMQGNEFEVLGPAHSDKTVREIVTAQMEDVYFPVTTREFGARVYYRDLREEHFDVGNIGVDTLLLKHPGACLGYKLSYQDSRICYITDNELYPEGNPYHDPEFEQRLVAFIRGVDILIIDCTYLDDEYAKKIGWGHSCVSEVVRIADRAEVKALHLFHHDPDQDDDKIDHKLACARKALAARGSQTTCVAPAEGSKVIF